MAQANDRGGDQNTDQHNRGGKIAFIGSLVFIGAFMVYLSFGYKGVDLHEQIVDPHLPGATLAEAVVDTDTIKDPWVANPKMVAAGKVVFSHNCTPCHGNEGKGDGPAGQALNPKPRNLVEGPWKKGGGYIGWFHVLAEGIPGGGMVAFTQLKTNDRWALVQFIDSITNAKVKEDPAKVAEFAKTAK